MNSNTYVQLKKLGRKNGWHSVVEQWTEISVKTPQCNLVGTLCYFGGTPV